MEASSLANIPVFITCRDRVTDLKALVAWLERVGQQRIYLVDMDSSYPPLLEYYEQTPHQVIRMDHNYGHVAVWNHGIIREHAPNEYYIVSDPDVVPVEYCPDHAIDHFYELLQRVPERTKCGFGLKIDDLPDHCHLKDRVIKHESQYWRWGGFEQATFAPIDTTFALYRPHANQDVSLSMRTREPFVARHMPWYLDSENLPEEEVYYRAHANQDITSWNKPEGPWWA